MADVGEVLGKHSMVIDPGAGSIAPRCRAFTGQPWPCEVIEDHCLVFTPKQGCWEFWPIPAVATTDARPVR